jgi:organic hydroperoxide reductase OsmC/OhrA
MQISFYIHEIKVKAIIVIDKSSCLLQVGRVTQEVFHLMLASCHFMASKVLLRRSGNTLTANEHRKRQTAGQQGGRQVKHHRPGTH